MKLFVRSSVCFVLLIWPLISFGQVKPKNVTIKGTVVAEYEGIPVHACYHVCGLSLVVKLDKPRIDTYVAVNVEYMDDHSRSDYGLPSQLVEKTARWKFDASVESNSSPPLQQYVRVIDQDGKDITKEEGISAWKLLRGAESESLPYGEQIPSYRVSPGKFKSIN